MEWTMERAAMLARYNCEICGGTGSRAGESSLCACVCRRVFQICYRKFRFCATAPASARIVTFGESKRGVDRHLVWIRRNEDYCADFVAAGRRVLSGDHWRVFRFHHLLGGKPELVAKRLHFSLRTFFRIVGEIEALAGRELALMQPYSLYPPHEYMKGGLPANVV